MNKKQVYFNWIRIGTKSTKYFDTKLISLTEYLPMKNSLEKLVMKKKVCRTRYDKSLTRIIK